MTPHDAAALRIVRDALDVDAEQRAALFDERCGDDIALRARVDALLRKADAVEDDIALHGTHDPQPADEIDRLIGAQLGPYAVIERIGRGGMGVVYRGERVLGDFPQQVALKLVRRGFDFDDVHARFLRERRLLARLSHPNIARLIDGGVAPDGRPWFALDFVSGVTITQWCDTRRLDIRERVTLLLQVCAAVQHAHTQLIVHLDLKPANVLVDDSGEARLLDFGIARLVGGDDAGSTLTLPGRHALTPEYAAPEQFDGDANVGIAADVYALGVILYELIAGVVPHRFARSDPFAGTTARNAPIEPLSSAIAQPSSHASTPSTQTLGDTTRNLRLQQRRATARAYRTAVRGDLSRIIAKALATEPERRYATVDAFASDLGAWLAGKPVQISGLGWGYRAGKFVRRHRSAVAVASVLALGMVATTAVAMRSAWIAQQQREAAMAEAARVSAVREYILLMFRNAAEQPPSGTLTARDVLARSADQIFERFRDRPDIGQATALSLSELYMQLGDVAGGAPLLERLIAWPGIDANPDVLARARYNLAQMEYARGNAGRARELLDVAQAYWATDAVRHRASLAESRTIQAQLERAEGHVDVSIATLEAAVAERRSAAGDNREGIGAALNALALALAAAGRFEDSAQRADEAYALFETMGASGNVIGLAALNNRASARMSLGQYDAAVADLRHAIALRRDLYGRSPELAGSQINLALALLRKAEQDGAVASEAQLDESLALIEDAYAIAREGGGDSSRITASARINLAEIYVMRGRIADADALAEDAVRIGQEQFGADSVFAGAGLRARARVRLAQGRRDEARADLDRAQAVFVAMGAGGESQLASLTRVRAQLDAAKAK